MTSYNDNPELSPSNQVKAEAVETLDPLTTPIGPTMYKFMTYYISTPGPIPYLPSQSPDEGGRSEVSANLRDIFEQFGVFVRLLQPHSPVSVG